MERVTDLYDNGLLIKDLNYIEYDDFTDLYNNCMTYYENEKDLVNQLKSDSKTNLVYYCKDETSLYNKLLELYPDYLKTKNNIMYIWHDLPCEVFFVNHQGYYIDSENNY